MENEKEKKIGLAEEVIIILILLGAWSIEVLVALTGFGIIISEFINGAVGAGMEIYFFLRGARGLRQLMTPVIGAIVETSAFVPGKLITAIIVFYMINHPKIAGIVAKVSPTANKLPNPSGSLSGASVGTAE